MTTQLIRSDGFPRTETLRQSPPSVPRPPRTLAPCEQSRNGSLSGDRFPVWDSAAGGVRRCLPLYLNDEESVGADIEGRRRLRVFDGGVASFVPTSIACTPDTGRAGDLKTVFLELSTEGRGICPCCGPHRRKVLHVQSGTPDPSGATSVSLDLAATSAGAPVVRVAYRRGRPGYCAGRRGPPGRRAHRDVVVDVAICPTSAPRAWSAVCRA